LKSFRITYLSDGPKNTGGYFYEIFWFNQLQKHFANKGHTIDAKIERSEHYHSGWWQTLKWFFHLFRIAKGDLIIVPGRCALPILLRNIFSRNKVFVVFHSMDINQLHRKKGLSVYYKIVFLLMKLHSNFFLVTIAYYWKSFFLNLTKMPLHRIHLLPNLFDFDEYKHYQTKDKQKNIHLGMWSTKQDKVIYDLASRLSHRGYYCFFTTPVDIVAMGAYGYDIIYCETQQEFKHRVATSLYTIALTSIPEGWSRVAHESFLLGTPVIGFPNAGLSELIQEGGGFIAENVQEIIEIIENRNEWELSQKFIQKFHTDKSNAFLTSIGL